MDMAALMQMLMAASGGSGEQSEQSGESGEPGKSGESSGEQAGGFDFADMFGNIDIEMFMKLGEVIAQLNKPDKNAELLLALRPHLREENRHKVDSALKMSRMMTLLPYLKESGFLDLS